MKDIPGTECVSYCNADKVYKVHKRINGPQKFLGSNKTLIGALMIRDWCQANNWKRYPKSNTKSKEPYIRVQEHAEWLYRYRVAKVINGTEYSFGSYPTIQEAVARRDYCIKHDWDLDLIPKNPLRFIDFIIRDNKIKYNIHYKKNGKSANYGLFDNIHEAMHERDLLEHYDWDWEVMCNLDERIHNETIYLNRRC